MNYYEWKLDKTQREWDRYQDTVQPSVLYAHGWSFGEAEAWDNQENITFSSCAPRISFEYRGRIGAMNKQCADCEEYAVAMIDLSNDCMCCAPEQLFFCQIHFEDFWYSF